jgi:hypothetical protein
MADIKTGMVVAAEGSQRADGSLDALAIRAGQPGRLRSPVDAPTGVPASPQPSTSQG